MITYQEWKAQQLIEAAAPIDIDGLVNGAIGDITKMLNTYVQKATPQSQLEPVASQQAAPQNSLEPITSQPVPAGKPGFFNKLNKLGSDIGSKAKQFGADYLKSTAKGSLQTGDPKEESPTHLSRLKSFGKKLKGQFWGGREWLELENFIKNALPNNEIKNLLVECGIHRWMLVENVTPALEELITQIRTRLTNLATELKTQLQPTEPQVATSMPNAAAKGPEDMGVAPAENQKPKKELSPDPRNVRRRTATALKNKSGVGKSSGKKRKA